MISHRGHRGHREKTIEPEKNADKANSIFKSSFLYRSLVVNCFYSVPSVPSVANALGFKKGNIGGYR
jgi:hypothetical protein